MFISGNRKPHELPQVVQAHAVQGEPDNTKEVSPKKHQIGYRSFWITLLLVARPLLYLAWDSIPFIYQLKKSSETWSSFQYFNPSFPSTGRLPIKSSHKRAFVKADHWTREHILQEYSPPTSQDGNEIELPTILHCGVCPTLPCPA